MADPFEEHSAGLGSPIEHAAAITPANDADLATTTRALFIGTAGTLKVDFVGSGTITFAAVPVGLYPWRVKKVYATGTDAEDIVGMW